MGIRVAICLTDSILLTDKYLVFLVYTELKEHT